MTALPLFSYPSTIVWVDDDTLFLKAITRTLGNNYRLRLFNDSYECLTFFENYEPFVSSESFLYGCVDHESFDTIDHMPVDLNADMLMKIRCHEARYDEISVVVIDYNMPNMNGLELCRKLAALPMKKILLTGEVEDPQAVSAFNEGLIDRFIRKDSPQLIEEVQLHLEILTKQYFANSTQGLLSHLEADQSLPMSDPVFISFFKDWCKANHICEHYLMDKHGNFIVMNHNGEISYFIIHTEKTLSHFVDLYEENEEIADLIKLVSQREAIPFFGQGKEAWHLKESEWSSHFYEPELLEGREKYFWKVVREHI